MDNSHPESPYVSVYLNSKMHSFNVSQVDSLGDAVNLLKSLFTFIQRNYQWEMGFGDIQYAVANGFLSGLDPHTIVFSPKAFSNFSVHIEGEIFGVGMYVGTRDGKLTVIEVLKGTPAARAKFKKSDTIVKIGDESTINMSVQEAVEKIRGPLKTEVVLTVKASTPESGMSRFQTSTKTRLPASGPTSRAWRRRTAAPSLVSFWTCAETPAAS